MKLLALITACFLTSTSVVSGMVSSGDALTTQSVNIPDIMGMSETEAIAMLETVTLPNDSAVEIIRNYEYSTEAAADVVLAQSLVGEVSAADAMQLVLTISLGMEPNELLGKDGMKLSPLSTFGLAAYKAQVANATDSRLGVEWEEVPASYEYNWDNSQNCWNYGVWVDGECYKTPEGEYSTDVRHKVQLYCDGEYVYGRVVFAREFGSNVNGADYRFTIDGQTAAFQIVDVGGNSVSNTGNLSAGTHQVEVRHGDGSISYEVAVDSLAYLTKYENDINPEVEFRIPLTEMQRQNSNIDLENMGTVEFFSPNLMYRPTMASGASTFPMASAGLALVMIPGSTMILKKKHDGKKNSKKSNKEADE